MIISFEIQNYLSFSGASTVDLSVGTSAPDNYHFLSNLNEKGRIAKIAGVYGANASGKTNIIRILPALVDFITESFSYKLDEATPFRTHFFHREKPISVSIEFAAQDQQSQEIKRYKYDLKVIDHVVHYERLRVKSSKLYSRVFERQWIDGQYKVQGLGEKQAANLRQNVSWLAWLGQYNVPEAVSIIQYFKRIKSNISVGGPRIPGFISTLGAVDVYRSNPLLSESMVAQLNRWDIDIHNVVYERIDGTEDGPGHWMAYCIHKLGDKEARLSILNESSGTMGLFSLLSIVLPVLERGGIAVIDELESDLHPHMLEAVLNLFVQPESNPHGAQLLFTSHADWLMNILHKTQIFLVDKKDAGSEVVRLSDIRGVAARENFSARYRAGSYGAVPEID
jgi:hypothetical protein